MKYWITADFHLNHTNIIRYCKRPFDSVENMNYELIRRWNEQVKSEDVIFFNGDFCFKNGIDWEQQLNGKIIFLFGNHDKHQKVKFPIKSIELFFDGKEIFITHRPKDFNPDIQTNLVGHVHDKWKIKKVWTGNMWCYLLNIGVDQWNFYPILLTETIGYIQKRKNFDDIPIITMKELLGNYDKNKEVK